MLVISNNIILALIAMVIVEIICISILNMMPIAIMTRCPHVILANPVYCMNCPRLSIIVFIFYSKVMIGLPWSTESPLVTFIDFTLPPLSASMSFSIFMASITATT